MESRSRETAFNPHISVPSSLKNQPPLSKLYVVHCVSVGKLAIVVNKEDYIGHLYALTLTMVSPVILTNIDITLPMKLIHEGSFCVLGNLGIGTIFD